MLSTPAAALAALFTAGEPLTKSDLAGLLEIPETELASILTVLESTLAVAGLALVETKDALELRTSPEAAGIVKKLWERARSQDLGKAGLETLAVIAYQDGVTRGEIDWVRGVNSSASIRTLLLRGLIEANEDPEDRRRLRYSLSIEALAHLGLKRREDLPRYAELAANTRSAAKEIAPES